MNNIVPDMLNTCLMGLTFVQDVFFQQSSTYFSHVRNMCFTKHTCVFTPCLTQLIDLHMLNTTYTYAEHVLKICWKFVKRLFKHVFNTTHAERGTIHYSLIPFMYSTHVQHMLRPFLCNLLTWCVKATLSPT